MCVVLVEKDALSAVSAQGLHVDIAERGSDAACAQQNKTEVIPCSHRGPAGARCGPCTLRRVKRAVGALGRRRFPTVKHKVGRDAYVCTVIDYPSSSGRLVVM